MERLLERISISKYHHNFVLKGGFLIAAMVGLDTRATMDMNATIKDWPVNEESIKKMALEESNVSKHTEGKEIVKVIIIKNKIVNIVVK